MRRRLTVATDGERGVELLDEKGQVRRKISIENGGFEFRGRDVAANFLRP